MNLLILTTAREGTVIVTKKQRLREVNLSPRSLRATQCQSEGTELRVGTVTVEKGPVALFWTLKPGQSHAL